MAQPGLSAVGSLNPALTDISIATLQDMTMFGAGRMFQSVPVAKQSAKYAVYTESYFNRTEVQKIAPGGAYPRAGFELSDQTYNAEVFGVEHPIPDQIRQNQSPSIDLEEAATIWGAMQMMIYRERDFLTSFFTSSVWTGGTGVSPTTKWDAPGSTPLADLRGEITSVQAKTGLRPNVIGMPRLVWDVLLDHTTVVGRLSNDTNKFVQKSFLAALLEVDEIVVFEGIQNTAAEGATAVNSFLANTDDVVLLYRPSSPGLFTPAAGYTFSWSAFEGAGPASNRVMTWRDERVASDIVRTEMAYDMKVVSPALGAYLSNVLA